MAPAKKGSRTYLGVGRDGVLRRCYFHYHSDSTQVAVGTADAIAKPLAFGSAAEMREYMERQM
jgi:hypothetical protein